MHRSSKAGRVARAILLTVAGAVILLAVAAVLMLRTDVGRGQLVRLVETLASGPDMRLSIGRLDGALPFDMTVSDVSVADREGVWLTLDRAHLAWRPLSLLSGVVEVNVLEAGRVAVARPPVPGTGPATEGSGPPRLPFGVIVERLAVEEVALGEALVGEPVSLAVSGDARLVDPADGLSGEIAIRRTDGVAATVDGTLRFVPDTGQLVVDVRAVEPAGGIVSRLAGLPDLPPLDFSLRGDGPLDNWRGDLALTLGASARAQATATITRDADGRQLALDGTADIAALLPDRYAPLAAGEATLHLRAKRFDDGRIEVGELFAEGAGGRVTGTGTLDEARDAVSGRLTLSLPSAMPYAALAPVALSWRGLEATATVEGPLSRPRLALTATGDGLSIEQNAIGRAILGLRAEADGAPLQPDTRFAFDLTADLRDLAPQSSELAGVVGSEAHLTANGTATLDGADIAALRLDLAPLAATFSGTVSTEAVDGKVNVERADLAALRAFMDRPLAGVVALTGDVSASFDLSRLAVTLNGMARGLETGVAQADGLLGRDVRLSGGFRRNADGSFGFERFTVSGAHVGLIADGSATENRANVTAKLDLPDLSQLDARVTGRADVDATLTGSLDALDARLRLVIDGASALGRPVERLAADIEARDLTGAATGTLSLSGSVDGKPATGSGRFARDAAGAVRVSDLDIGLGSVRAQGAFDISPASLASGRLTLRAGDLADIAPLLLTKLAGAVDLDLTLSSEDGRQNLVAKGRVSDFSGFDASLARADIDLSARDVLGRFAADGKVMLERLAVAGVDVPRAEISAEGTREATRLSLGGSVRGIDVAADARLAMRPDETVVTLDSASASRGGQRVTVARGAVFTLRDGTVAVSGLTLNANGGSLAVSGSAGERLDLSATMRNLPLALAELAAPGLGLAGQLSGEAQIAGSPSRPDGRYRLSVSGFTMPQIRDAGLAPLAVEANGTLADGRAGIDASVRGISDAPIRITGSLPTTAEGNLDLAVAGRIDLAVANRLAAADGQRYGGTATADLRLAGTFAAPRAEGTVRLTGGRFEDVVNGILLSDIDATITGSERELVIQSLAARARNGGRITGSGRIALDPAAGFPGSISLRAANAQLVSNDTTNAIVGFDLSVAGPMATAPRVTGRVTVDNLQIFVPDRLPPSVTPIEVRHKNAPPRVAERVRAQERQQRARAAGGGFDAALDITVDASSGRVLVRGQGINAELGGTLAIRGTSSNPVIDGGFSMRRGTFQVLGRRLTFTRGNVTFPGTLDPQIDFVAEAPAGDVTARVAVDGIASSPQIRFSSSPELPQDEVLARLLFGKPSGNLTAGQALQLAQAVAQFAGGNRVLDDLSRSLGVDAVDIDTDASGNVAVGVGKRINDNIYLGVKQGATPDSSRVTVDIDITDHIKVQGEAGADGSSAVGIGMEWDY